MSKSLMIIHQFRPLTGGAELQAERLSESLAALGHKVAVLTKLLDTNSKDLEVRAGINIHRVSFPFPNDFTAENNYELFYYLIKHGRKYDIFHVHQAFGHAMTAILAAKLLKKKSILKIACAGDYGDLRVLTSLDGAEHGIKILRQVDAVIAISEEIKNELVDNGFDPKRIHRIPNGVDTDYFKRKLLRKETIPFRIVLIGRRTPQKGIDVALKALTILKTFGYDENKVLLEMYGRDSDEFDYQKMAISMNVHSMTRFNSFAGDMVNIYDNANAFILPSRGEGLSNSLLEAMSMSLPVVTTTVSGNTEVIDNNINGILIEPNNPELLANSIMRLITTPKLSETLGIFARTKVIEKYSMTFVAKKYSELYKTLTNPKVN